MVNCSDVRWKLEMGRIAKKIADRANQSLVGHIVFFEIISALPLLTYGILSNYAEGTLSVGFAVQMVVGITAIVAIGAAAVWFVITLPLKKKAGR